MNLINIKYSCLFLILLFGQSCHYHSSQRNQCYGFEKESLKYFQENDQILDTSILINRMNDRVVVFSFFEEFNDSLEFIVNGNIISKWKMLKDTTLSQSSGYSGKDYGVELKRNRVKVVVKLLSQKKYVEFYVNKKYPLYTIQRYSNTWYINARKRMMIIK